MDSPDPSRASRLKSALHQRDRAALLHLANEQRKPLLRAIELRLEPGLAARVSSSDVLQETILEVDRRLPQYLEEHDPEERMPFFQWLRFLALQNLNRAYRAHLGAKKRDVRREQTLPAHDGTDDALSSVAVLSRQLADSAGTASQGVANQEVRALLTQSLERLPEEEREILILRHFECLGNQEIAALLGISESRASRRHLRAVKNLRIALERVGVTLSGALGN